MNKKEINDWFMESISEIQSLYITPKYLDGTAKHYQSINYDKDMITIDIEHPNYDIKEDRRRNKGETKGQYPIIPDNFIFSFLESTSNCPVNILDYQYHLSSQFTSKLIFSGSVARAMLNFIGASTSKGEWNTIFNNQHYKVDIKFSKRSSNTAIISFKVTNILENRTHALSLSTDMFEFQDNVHYLKIHNFSPNTVKAEYEKRMAELDEEIERESEPYNASGNPWRDAYGDQVDDPGFNADC